VGDEIGTSELVPFPVGDEIGTSALPGCVLPSLWDLVPSNCFLPRAYALGYYRRPSGLRMCYIVQDDRRGIAIAHGLAHGSMG
jgi:hypothetical protein